MLVTRVSKFVAFAILTIAAVTISAGPVEYSGNVADGTGAVLVGPAAAGTPHPGASPMGDVTWGG